jgi:hypothetical protein
VSTEVQARTEVTPDAPNLYEKRGEGIGRVLGAGVGAAFSFGSIAKIATALGATGVTNFVTGTTGTAIATFFTAGAGAFIMPLLGVAALAAAGYYVYKHGFLHPKTLASGATGIGAIYNVADQVTRNNASLIGRNLNWLNDQTVDILGSGVEWVAPATAKTYTVISSLVPVAANVGAGAIGGGFLGKVIGGVIGDIVEAFRPQPTSAKPAPAMLAPA